MISPIYAQVEANLKVLEDTESELSTTEDDPAEPEDEPAEPEEDDDSPPLASTSHFTLSSESTPRKPKRKRKHKAKIVIPEEKSILREFIFQTRIWLDHIKTEFPLDFSYAPPRVLSFTSLTSSFPSLGTFPSPSETAVGATKNDAVNEAEDVAPELESHDTETWYCVENISKKLETVHQLLITLASFTSLPTPTSIDPSNPIDDNSTPNAKDPPKSSPNRSYSFNTLRESLPAIPAPLPSLRAFFIHESLRLSQLLQETSFPSMHLPELTIDSLRETANHLVERIDLETEKLKKAFAEGTRRLLNYDELPEPFQNNPWIKGGYRFIPIERWKAILWSLVELHNETCTFSPFLIYVEIVLRQA